MNRWLTILLGATLSALPAAARSTLPGSSARSQEAGPGRTFEVVSIKPLRPESYPPGIDLENPCSGALPMQSGRTLVGRASTLYALIALAYNPWQHAPRACDHATTSDLISGGPDWIKSERFAIEALLPADADLASYQRLLNTGDARDVQQMLQTVLEQRFKLKLRRELKEIPVYLMTLDQTAGVAEARMAQSRKAGHAIAENLQAMESIFTTQPTAPDGTRYVSVWFGKQPLARLANRLATGAQRPVLDRTGLAGTFDFILEYDNSGQARPTLFTALREQLGLRLQASRAPIEALVVEQAERPSEN